MERSQLFSSTIRVEQDDRFFPRGYGRLPVHLLSAAERDRANPFPGAITDEDLTTFFTLSEEDHKQIPVDAGPMLASGLGLNCVRRA